mmetsp:Transcript_111308/g.325557  ORF Transcript_111308/g.325557 Transcript_111308/m.325557 type:complete len:137 (+) Transcript_111308:37-447(+)
MWKQMWHVVDGQSPPAGQVMEPAKQCVVASGLVPRCHMRYHPLGWEGVGSTAFADLIHLQVINQERAEVWHLEFHLRSTRIGDSMKIPSNGAKWARPKKCRTSHVLQDTCMVYQVGSRALRSLSSTCRINLILLPC